MNTNIVKETAKELGMTYKEFGELIGYGESAVKKAASTGEVSSSMYKAVELYKKVLALEEEKKQHEYIKSTLKSWLK